MALKKPEERIKKQRAGGDPNVKYYTKQELYERIRTLPEMHQALAAFLYLTGCRISEVVGNQSIKYPSDPIKRDQVEIKEYKGGTMIIINITS